MNVTVTDVLGSLFNPTDTVCFRVFDDKKGGVFQGSKLQCECGKYKSIEETLKNHNALSRGVFFVVNYGGHDDDSITRINAQFVEMDHDSFEDQQKKIDAFPLAPSMIMKTQKSLHVYWFMDSTAKVERFRMIQTQLVKHFDGDPMCVNESRVMRLPGFNHCKKDTPVEVTCISFHPERKYTQDQLSDVLPEVDLVPVEKKSGTEKGLDAVMRSCIFLQHCRDDATSLSEHDWYAMITNLAPFEGGTKLIHELSAPYPGYTEGNTQKKINHFLESGTKPITCQTICEKGFKCPKFAAGECPVKSPAALCYHPLGSDILLDILHGLPVTGEAIKDLQTARQFVTDYLYNQDVVTADVVINSEIRDHFKLKASFLKSLNMVFKDASKMYQASKNAKRAKAGTAIPDWYEPTDNGLRFLPGVLAKDMSEQQQVFYAAEQHFNYRGGVYVEMSEMEAQRLVQEKMLIRETKMSQIIDAEKQWRLLVQRDIRELNANPYIINVRNGLYNVLEDTLTPHTPEYYSTVQLNVTYDKKADCPLFKKFLMESMGGDMEQVGLIQEMLGYFLIPVNSAQKCFVIVGVASAGKSVLLRVLNDVLLGKQNVSNVSWQALNERFKTAELFGKLANIFADLPTKNVIVETSADIFAEQIKRIVTRIAGSMAVISDIRPQDEILAGNQKDSIRCGDNGIFKGMPVTEEQKTLSKIARDIYTSYPYDGKHILNQSRLIICQSNAKSVLLKKKYKGAEVNPLGEWTGGTDVDTGATNRKLGSDMGDSVTGGGLHGKDLSKADVSVNIYAFLKAQETGKPVELCCAIGDEAVGGIPYSEIVETARKYIADIGGFEKFAEWGLI